MRARMRETLGALAQARFIEGGAAISRRVLDEVGRARVVMAFVPMRRGGRLMEADITDLLDGVVAAGKRLALARGTSDGGVEACEVGEDWRGEVVESALKGVMEPAATARRVSHCVSCGIALRVASARARAGSAGTRGSMPDQMSLAMLWSETSSARATSRSAIGQRSASGMRCRADARQRRTTGEGSEAARVANFFRASAPIALSSPSSWIAQPRR